MRASSTATMTASPANERRVLLGDEPLCLARDDRKELVGILAAEGVPISYELCC
jgi:hypothetical protein